MPVIEEGVLILLIAKPFVGDPAAYMPDSFTEREG